MVMEAQDTEIMPGYKLTEVGVIPEDWEVKNIGDLVTFSGGSQPPRSTFKFQKRGEYVRLIQIRDYKTDEFETYIPKELARKKCTVDDIMIGRYGPPIFQILRGIEGAYNVALLKAIPSSRIDREYLYHFLRQDSLFRYIELLSQRSSGQTGIEMPALKNYPFPLPPLPEQHAIATALSDIDALITSLDKLIAKKRDIKQATMQQLLTGKTRLPGFSGDWVVKKLGERCEFYSGGTPNTSNPAFYGGSISWITSSDLNMGRIKEVEGRITKLGFERSSAQMVKKGTLLLALYGATAGVTAITEFDAAINQAVLAIIPQKDNSEFLFQKLTLLKNWLIKTYTQGGQPNLSGQIVKSIEFSLPLKPEQTAIATVLTDMDAEIAALEQKRKKTRMLKQGMMQELLTGKTRLI